MDGLLWVIAAILIIAGIVIIARGALLMGIVFIILGFLVGPGGVSLFSDDDDGGGDELAPITLEVAA